MATYKGIQGYSVQTLTSDPSPIASAEGQLWYNSTSGTYKIAAAGVGAWSAGGNLNDGRGTAGAASNAPVSAALYFGGHPGVAVTGNTESYNGSSWTEVNDLNTARQGQAGFGTQTASVSAGGGTPPVTASTETWNGTSWTEATAIPVGTTDLSGAGISTAGLIFAGTPPSSGTNLAAAWNGSAWTVGGSLNTGRIKVGGFGLSTAAISAAGRVTFSMQAIVESYNGSAWTEVGNVNTARASLGSSGTQALGMVYGGDAPPNTQVVTETWDGTSWTEVADLATGRDGLRGCGTTNTAALAIGGGASPYQQTEEWDGAPVTVKTVTVS